MQKIKFKRGDVVINTISNSIAIVRFNHLWDNEKVTVTRVNDSRRVKWSCGHVVAVSYETGAMLQDNNFYSLYLRGDVWALPNHFGRIPFNCGDPVW